MAGIDEFNTIAQQAAEAAAGFAEAEAIRRQAEADAVKQSQENTQFYSGRQSVDAQRAARKIQGYTGVNPNDMEGKVSMKPNTEKSVYDEMMENLSKKVDDGQVKQGKDFVIVAENHEAVDTSRIYTKEDIEKENEPDSPENGEEITQPVQENSAAVENEVMSKNELVNTEKMLEKQLKDGHFVNKADIEKISQKYLEDVAELTSKGTGPEEAQLEANKLREAAVENIAKHAQKYDENSLRQMQVQAAMKGERFDVYRKEKGRDGLIQTTVGRTNMTLKQFQKMGKAKEGVGIASRRIGGQGFAMRNAAGQVLQGDAASMSKGTLMLTVSLAIVLLNSLKKSLDQSIIKNIEKALSKNVDFVDMDTLSKMVEDAQKDKSAEVTKKEGGDRGEGGDGGDRVNGDGSPNPPTPPVSDTLPLEPQNDAPVEQPVPMDVPADNPMEQQDVQPNAPVDVPVEPQTMEQPPEDIDSVTLDEWDSMENPDFEKEINEISNSEKPMKPVKSVATDAREGVGDIKLSETAAKIGDSTASNPIKNVVEEGKDMVENVKDISELV